MVFLEDHPEIAGRSCEDCKKWAYDKYGQKIVRADGTPEPRPIPPDCVRCVKNSPEAEELTILNFLVYRKYILCKAMGCLPRSGGLENQDPAIVKKFELLAMIDRQRELASRIMQSLTM